MNVEIVADKMPLSRLWLGCDSVLNVLQKILFVAGLTGRTSHQLARGDVEIEHESERPVPNVFKLTSLYMAWHQRQAWMFAFQRLNPRHFIGAFNPLPLLG